MAYYIYVSKDQCELDAIDVKLAALEEIALGHNGMIIVDPKTKEEKPLHMVPIDKIKDINIFGKLLGMRQYEIGQTEWIYGPQKVADAEIYYQQTTGKYSRFDSLLTRYAKRIQSLPDGWVE